MSRGSSGSAGAKARRWSAAERIPGRRRTLLAGFVVAALLVVGRGVHLQGFEGEKWVRIAVEQHQERVTLPARRGAILDRDGVPLALTRESFRISVAPRELRDRGEAERRLREALGLSRAEARRATDPGRRWVVLRGRWGVEERAALDGVRGVHFERLLERFYPQGRVGREVLGVVSGDGRALGGMEQEMDAVLRGVDGWSVLRRDARGRSEPTLALPVVPPADGADVVLTLDFDLQEIADAALERAVRETGATGGDLLLADPRTGELLAAVSRRRGAGAQLSALVEPYEPGSTLKPFFVAALLAEGRAELTDRVFAEEGSWRTPQGRVIRDVHPYEWLTLRDALRVSSNIAMAKLSDRLKPAEQWRWLRDFGFGSPTGIDFPAESGGRLQRPERWTALSPASHAMGYEVSVTPLQMLMAYGAIANGGVLMEPRLVREVRGAGGATLRRDGPRAVRRVIPGALADSLRSVLVSVVDDGTATRASLATFAVAGKTGTARRTGPDGRYERGAYNATFVGFFPASDPQLVIYVKLDRPQGSYYGGVTAAPVTRETLHAILAARATALDGRGLLAARASSPAPVVERGRSAGDPRGSRRLAAGGAEGTYVFESPAALSPEGEGAEEPRPAPVPALEGLPLRDAVRRLHAVGLRVRLRGGGAVRATEPAAGAMLTAGDTVVLVGEEER